MRRVAVTGFGVVSPIGVGRPNFWSALREGRSGIDRITHFDCSTFDVQLAGEVKEELSFSEAIAPFVQDDPKVGFACVAVAEALESARIERLGQDTLLHLATSLEIFHLHKTIFDGKPDFARVVEQGMSGRTRPVQVPLDTACRLIADRYGRPAQSLTNCSACAAGAQAIGQGLQAVREGRFEVAVCGGFDSMLNPLGVGGFQLLGALTTDNARGANACRPFDISRSGTVLGEGAAVVVLEPLERARAEGKAVLAEVCGYGSALDAHSLSAPDPEGEGAVRAMRAALDDAGLEPDAIAHVNAHGTGTHLNDEIEAKAIRRVFEGLWERIPVSAVKAMTGHLIAAAGAVEVGACLMTLVELILPPNPSLETVGRGCDLNHVTDRAIPFEGEYLLTNSFGFGGQNATLVLRKYDD